MTVRKRRRIYQGKILILEFLFFLPFIVLALFYLGLVFLSYGGSIQLPFEFYKTASLWQKLLSAGITGFVGLIGILWVFAHLHLRHKKDKLLIEIDKNPNYLSFQKIPFHHWLLKHLPYSLQPNHIRKIKHKHYSVSDALGHFLYHHHFAHIRRLVAIKLIIAFIISSTSTYILFFPPLAFAAANVHEGNAHVSWTDSLGTSRSRMTVSTTNSVNAHTDKAWEITPGASQTLFINQQTVSGAAPPALPTGTGAGGAFDYCNIFIYYENETSSPVQQFTNTGCPASVSFTNTTKAGTYRIRVVFRDCSVGVTSCTTFLYPEQNSDANLGTGDNNNHKGALRVGMDVTSVTVSAYPAGSTFAYGTSGNEDLTITVNHTQPQGTATSEDIRINSRKNGSGTPTETGATKKAASGGSTTQAFTTDNTYTAELAGYDGEIELIGNSPLTGEKWTHINTATSPVVKDSATVARRPDFFNIDPRISLANVSTGQTVYNRGEATTHQFQLLNARNENLTRSTTWNIRDSANTVKSSKSDTGSTYGDGGSGNYTIGSSDDALNNTTGVQWNIITTLSDAHNVSNNIYKTSTLLRISTVNTGNNSSGIDDNTLTFLNSGYTQSGTVFNLGETVYNQFYLYGARGQLISSSDPNGSGLALTVKNNSDTTEEGPVTVSVDASNTGRIRWNYALASGDTATNDTTGSPKKFSLTVNGNTLRKEADGTVESGNEWLASNLLRIATVNTGTINHNTLTYRDSGYSTAETVFNRGETVYNQFYLYGVRGQLVTDTSPIGTTLSLQVKNSAGSSEGSAVSASADTNGRVRWNYTVASGHTATNDTAGSPKHFELTKTGNSLRQGSGGTLGSGDEWNVSSLLTVNNIWHSKLQADSAEYNQFSLSGDNMEIRSRIFDVRGNNKENATVTTYLYKPDTSLSQQWDFTTASDGWTSWRTIAAAAPVGNWELKAEATDANSNSAPLATEEITLGTMHDPVRLSASPLLANPDDTVQIVIHESYLSGIAVTGNAANTTVFIYNPSNTLVVNGANPTEIDNGSYRYNYSLGASPALGNWYAVVRSQIGSSTDIFTSVINFYVENQDTVIGNFSINDTSPSTTAFVTTLTSSVDDFYNNGVILFTNGPNANLVRRISDYVGSTKTVTVDPVLPATPTNGDKFSLLKQTASSAGGGGGGATAAEIWAHSTRRLTDATLTGGGSLATTAELAAVETKVNTLQATVNTIVTNTTDIASQVWNALTSAFSTSGSFAKLIKDNIDAAISSRSTQTSVDTVQSDVTAIKNNVATLITEVGTGNISAIKTKTDTISWGDITGLVTTTGAIKTKTDTIDWTQVAAIKTKTDTISWADVTGIDTKVIAVQSNVTTLINEVGEGNITAIKTKTDTIAWNDVTGLVTSNGQIKTKTDTIAWTDVEAIKTKTDTIIWDDVTGIKTKTDTIEWSDVTAIKANVNTGTTGTVSDTSPSASSFKTSLTQTKNDFYKNMLLVFTSGQNNGQSRRISGYNGSTKTITIDPEFSYTPANGDTFLVNVTSTRVEELTGSAKSTIESVQSKLDKLAGTLPSDYKGMYEQLKSVADTLEKLGVLKGSGADSLYAISAAQKDDIKYLKNKMLDLQAALEINKLLLAGGKQNSVFSTWYTFNSVVINMIVANPTSRTAKIPFKAYLPKEAKPEHIISTGGLKVDYEEPSQSYIVTGEFELGPGESITKQVEMKDIWVIDEEEITTLKKQAEELYKEAQKTVYSSQALILKNDTVTRLDKILRKQKESNTTPQEHILAFRDNQQELAVAKDNLKKMSELVTAASAGRGLLASVGGIQTIATWGIIVVLIAGLGIMSLFFYSMWRHQMMVVSSLTSGSGSGIKQLPMHTVDGDIIENSLNPLSVPKITVNWARILPRIKVLFIVLVALGILFTGIKWGIPSVQNILSVSNDKKEKEEGKTSVSPSPTPTPTPKVLQVEILETETGWLNVREKPSKQGKILIKVDVGDQFVELARTKDENGEEWVKIKLEDKEVDEIEGWISGEYVGQVQE